MAKASVAKSPSPVRPVRKPPKKWPLVVAVVLAIGLILMTVAAIVLHNSGGEHGPWMHQPGQSGPPGGDMPPGHQRPKH